MGPFTGGELALHGGHRLEHKLVVLGRHGVGSRHLRAHGRNGLLRIADGKLLDQKRRQILGNRRFGNAPCQEASNLRRFISDWGRRRRTGGAETP